MDKHKKRSFSFSKIYFNKIIKLSLVFTLLFSCSKDSTYSSNFVPDIIYGDGDVEIVFENKKEGINVVFIGEGYIQNTLAGSNGTYRQDALQHIEFLFDQPPFSEYKDYFNAYIIYAASEEEGPSATPREKNTALGLIQGDPNPIGYDTILLTQYIQKLLPDYSVEKQNTLVLLSVNKGRGGFVFYGEAVAIFASTRKTVMVHEVGHAFAGLGDEYENNINCTNCSAATEIYSNLDNTKDINKIKWSHFIGLEGYEAVGAYEGGGYTTSGIWRPEENSIMRNSSFPHFNAPSREAIVKKIMEINGIPYDFQEFIKNDKVVLDHIESRNSISKDIYPINFMTY